MVVVVVVTAVSVDWRAPLVPLGRLALPGSWARLVFRRFHRFLPRPFRLSPHLTPEVAK